MTMLEDTNGQSTVISGPPDPADFPRPLPQPGDEPGEIIVVMQQVAKLQAQIDTLTTTNTQQSETNIRLTAAMCTLPCPADRYEGLPEEGWTGRPEDYPGAHLSTIGECLEYVCCDCCRALVVLGGIQPTETALE